MKLLNYYEILGVFQDAPAEEIKKRYTALVLKFHPDKESSSIAG
ncbi:MAG: DnaJ domain-containing protein, partial [Patescibacteria group bacterium]|nr:DnaJ domain-containing protein [Patescibacteria group bacterium]